METRASPGVALLPPETVEQLLADRRKVAITPSCLKAICRLSSSSASACWLWQHALVARRAPLGNYTSLCTEQARARMFPTPGLSCLRCSPSAALDSAGGRHLPSAGCPLQGELVQPFKLALLKLASQEAAHLMAGGQYDDALPIALEAVKQGQALFQPQPAIQLFPLYLLAAQVRSASGSSGHVRQVSAPLPGPTSHPRVCALPAGCADENAWCDWLRRGRDGCGVAPSCWQVDVGRHSIVFWASDAPLQTLLLSALGVDSNHQ